MRINSVFKMLPQLRHLTMEVDFVLNILSRHIVIDLLLISVWTRCGQSCPKWLSFANSG
jgi:hypothetical protein